METTNKEIYNHRYEHTSVSELKLLSQELIVALDSFYSKVDEIRWYLYYTEDMPTTVEDNLYLSLGHLEKVYFNLEMYIDAEISQEEIQEDIQKEIQEELSSDIEDDCPPEVTEDFSFEIPEENSEI